MANPTIGKDAADAAATRTRNAGTAAQNAETNIQKEGLQAGLDKSTIARNYAAAQNSQAEARLHQSQTGVNGVKPLTVPQTAEVFNTISGIQGQINEIQTNGYDSQGHALTAQQAYHIIASGGKYFVSRPKGGNPKLGQVLTAVSAKPISKSDSNSMTLLNAAFNLQTVGHISQADLAALNASGVYGVRSRYSIGVGAGLPGAGGAQRVA